ncbi:MAG: tetratricopeptide repeat protein, partial [Phycisphaerae bacterium]|nr:tetratricopeptide repeat protein [Phycisphaerae bacterium]MDW8262692.1 tetratricopeptide repeat protein [Phycisphaerales bacterium]
MRWFRWFVLAFLPALAAAAPPMPLVQVVDFGLPPLEYPSYYGDLDRARLQVFCGRYRTALATIWRSPERPVEISLLEAEALAHLGRRDLALQRLEAGPLAGEARAALLRSLIRRELGQLEAAADELRTLIQKQPDLLIARLELALTLEDAGRLDEALAEYRWFVEAPQNFLTRLDDEADPLLDSAENLTTVARALDRWATLTGAFQKDESLHNRLLNAFVRVYDQIDRRYWPARVAAAEYWLWHDNSRQAVEELKAASAINPNAPRIHELLGRIAVESFQFELAESAVRALRWVDPLSVRADLLEARLLLASRRPLAAEAPLRRVLRLQPRNITALGLLAACNALRLREHEAAAILQEVDQIDPDNATAYFEVAEQLGAM